jgi:uncharacterized membrane protein
MVQVLGVALGHVALGSELPEYTVVNLHPLGAFYSRAQGISADGQVQVGYAGASHFRAWLWRGNGLGGVNLHPAGWANSDCRAVSADGKRQGGYVWDSSSALHAAKWVGSSQSFEDIHPPVASSSHVEALSGDGFVAVGMTFPDRMAAVWRGASFESLHPGDTGFPASKATGVSSNGMFAVGALTNLGGGQGRAIRWNISSGTYELHGSAFTYLYAVSSDGSRATGSWGDGVGGWSHGLWMFPAWTFRSLDGGQPRVGLVSAISSSGGFQTGYRHLSNAYGATVWSGSASALVIDLHSLLSAGYDHSYGLSVSDNGDVAGYAYRTMPPRDEAILWRRNWVASRGEPMELFLYGDWGSLSPTDQYLKHVDPFPDLYPGSTVTRVSQGGKADLTRVHNGGDECVGLVRALTGLGPSSGWRPAATVVIAGRVRDDLRPGTAIATFDVNGKYASVNPHTAIVLRKVDDLTVEVVDQNYFGWSGYPRIVAKHSRLRIGAPSGSTSDLTRYKVIAVPRLGTAVEAHNEPLRANP